MAQVDLISWVFSFTLSFVSTLAPLKTYEQKLLGCEHDLGPRVPCLEVSHLVKRHFHCSEDCWQRSCIDMRPRCWSLDQQLGFLPKRNHENHHGIPTKMRWLKLLPSNHLVKSHLAVEQATSSPILDVRPRLTMYTFGGLYKLLVLFAMPISY